jgi:hypothetical protein
MAQFRVVLDQVELDDKQHAQLDRALQKTTLQFLADIDHRGDSRAFYIPRILRPPLAGIWISTLPEEIGVLEQSGIRDRVKKLNDEITKGVDL